MKTLELSKKILRKTRKIFFPTKWDKEVKRYFKDGGDDHFRYTFDLDADSLVLDFGGYKGQWASDIYSRYNCRIITFEPVGIFAEKIIKRFKKNPKIEIFPYALGASKRVEPLGVSEDGSSLFTKSNEIVTINIEDVATFFNKFNIGQVDLMKINNEGGEYELLTRLIDTGLIKQVKQIQVQFHNIELDSESKMKSICSKLLQTHRPTFQYEFVWENWILLN